MSAPSIIGESGYGGHSAIALSKILAGKVASCSPFFDERTHGVSGSATIADLPTALELAVLVMTAPNRDEAAFQRVMDRLRSDVENRDRDPSVKFQDRLVAINTSNSPRRRPLTKERLAEIDLDRALAFHRASFANAANFAFFFVGNLDEARLIPEVERTLGSLPSLGKPDAAWVERAYPLPKESLKEIVRAGVEPKSLTVITFRSYDGLEPRQWHRIRSACSILQRRLRETLREKLGATYGVSADYDRMFVGPDEGKIRIRYGADPRDAERLGEESLRIVDELRADGPTEEEVATEKTLQSREMETSLRENGFWLGSLRTLWVLERPFTEILDRQARIDALDRASLHETMEVEWKMEPRTWVGWLPES
jgi:zinc protease